MRTFEKIKSCISSRSSSASERTSLANVLQQKLIKMKTLNEFKFPEVIFFLSFVGRSPASSRFDSVVKTAAARGNEIFACKS